MTTAVAMRDRYARSHPAHTERADAVETWDLFTRGYSTAAHFTAYAPATTPPMRLSHESLPLLARMPRMRLLVADIDPPGHGRSIQWDDDLRTKVQHRGYVRISLRGADPNILAAADALLQRAVAVFAIGDVPRERDEVTLKLSRPFLRLVREGAT